MFRKLQALATVAMLLLANQAAVAADKDWRNNKLGMLDPSADAPKPWSNLEVAGRTVKCWGRDYMFGSLGLPDQVKVLDRDILAGPIHLEIVTPSGAVAPGGIQLVAHTPQKVTFDGQGNVKGLLAHTRTEIEFDGMIHFTVKLEPESGPARIEKVFLDIPLESNTARFVLPYHTDGKDEFPLLQSDKPWQEKHFNPQVWIGDDDRGLAWFAEDAAGWHVAQGNAYFTTAFDGRRVTLRINVIDTPTELKAPLVLSFGLQATPLKPRREDWKQLNFRTKSNANCNVPWPRPDFQKYYAFPEAPADSAKWEGMLKETKYLFPLTYVNAVHDQHPFYKYFQDRLAAPGTEYKGASSGYPGKIVPVNIEEAIWRDYFLNSENQYIQKWRLKGLYHDVWGPLYDKNGRLPIWTFRELAKREFLMHRQFDPQAWTICHSAGIPIIPCLSFCDVTLQGEQVRTDLIKDGYYLSIMSLDRFRVENYIVNFGTQPMVLPQLGSEGMSGWSQDQARSLHLTGLCFLHDASIWVSWMNREPFDALEPIWTAWRQKGSFHPYWRATEPGFRVRSSNSDVAVSYYETPEGLLLVALNTQDDHVETKIAVALEDLNLGENCRAVVHDYLAGTNKAFSMDEIRANKGIPLMLEEYAPVLIEIK